MAMLLMMMIAMDVLTVHLDDYHEDGDDPSDDDSDYGDDGDVYEGNQTGRQAGGGAVLWCQSRNIHILLKPILHKYCPHIVGFLSNVVDILDRFCSKTSHQSESSHTSQILLFPISIFLYVELCVAAA